MWRCRFDGDGDGDGEDRDGDDRDVGIMMSPISF